MSLPSLARAYIQDAVKRYASKGTLVLLVLDPLTQDSVFRVVSKDAMLRFTTSVELIDSARRNQPYIEALYLVEPTAYNLSCIEADLLVKRYKRFHALLVRPPDDDEIADRFRRVFESLDSIDVLPLGLYVDEDNVWRCDTHTVNSMPIYYKEDCRNLVMDQINIAAHLLVSMCVMCGEYPLVRYYGPQKGSYAAKRLPELIAREFQDQIDSYARLHNDFPPESERPRSILLITDRTMDLFAPILHEFSYQAMAMDVVPELERELHYTYVLESEKGEKKEVTVVLNDEEDSVWTSVRHLHIIEALELVVAKINDLIAKNPRMIERSNATLALDLLYIVAHLQGFDYERKQLTLHKSLIDEILEINSQRKLAEFAADFEQTCTAEGQTFEGEKHKSLADELIVLLARDDLHINDKMRLIVIYALYRGGIIEADFRKMVKFIGLTDLHMNSVILRCFDNLELLGCPVVKLDIKIKRLEKKTFHEVNNEGTFNTSRFIPGLKAVLRDAQNYSLDEEWFPYYRDKPLEEAKSGGPTAPVGSLRNQRIKALWAQLLTRVNGDYGLGSSSREKTRQRVFCWVAGGMTYSEMRSVYELLQSNNCDFYIGSELILRPRDFLIGLQSIDKDKNREDLDLWWDRKKPTKAPRHLWEDPQQKKAEQVQRAAAQRPVSGGNLNAGGILTPGRVSTPPQPNVSSGVPLHYQTRLNRNPQSPELSEKKKKGLRRLFK